MPVTMKQIAERSGVSRPTVSLVLNGKAENFAPETRARVIEMAREMGYRPNAAARAVKEGRLGNIALLLSTHEHRSDLPPGLLSGIDEAASSENQRLTIARLSDAQLTDAERTPLLLREYSADGFLINYFDFVPRELDAQMERASVPSVWINRKLPANAVYPDDYTEGVKAANRLLEFGHRRIAFASLNGTKHYSAADRFAGYASVMMAAGLAPTFFGGESKIPNDDLHRFVSAALETPDRPTAIIANIPREALAVAGAAAVGGLRLGSDLSLTTFDVECHNYLGVWIDTHILPEAEVGRGATRMLLDLINTGERERPAVGVPFTHERGESCGPPVPIP